MSAPKEKVLLIGPKARIALIKGAETLANAVRLTFGPFSQHAAIEKGNEIIDDGVTVAREVVSGCISDEIEERGARMLLEVATKTDEVAGDGTTTATILGYEITKEASKYLSDGTTFAGKRTPAAIQKQLDKELAEVTEKLKAMSTKITSKEQLIEATTVSATDPELGKLIGETQWELGSEGVIIAEDTAEPTMSVERVHGIRLDNGFGTSFIINNQERGALEVKNVNVIMTNYVINELAPLKSILNTLAGMRAKVVIIGRGFGEIAIKECMKNIDNGFEIYPINAPFVDQNEIMKDMVSVLGGRYIATENESLENIMISDVGVADKVVVHRWTATITGKETKELQQRMKARVAELEKSKKASNSDFEKKNIENRIAQLTNGYAILKVGAASATRRKYLKRKADDAVNAARAALQEGVVAGGGMAFAQIADELPSDYILRNPLKKILEQITSSSPDGFTVDLKVKDSVKVLRIALEQAVSVASTFANSGIAIAEKRNDPADLLLKRLSGEAKKE